ncbi:MAG: phosphoribosylanthranilate isomerase [Gammaproteobacteria bacterium]|nr:phosphoribosylanthranilate isomerase [Gammaproteobacteria bacterium]
MSVFVKICGLRDGATVKAAVAAGANAVGFVFAASPREVSVEEAIAAAANVPDNVRRVAVMRHPAPEAWDAVRNGFAPDVLQTDAEDFARLDVPAGIEKWPVFREGGESVPNDAGTFVFEGPSSGTGETVNWEQAAALSKGRQMILAGGLDAANVPQAIATVRPWGVDVSSGVESAPGEKDANRIRRFISAARAAEKQ